MGNDTITAVVTPEETRATWSAAFINDLPDSSFACVRAGKKDADGKTTPRTNRFLPYKDADGKIDLPHLRTALSRISQADLTDAERAKAQKVLDAAAKKAGVGQDDQKDDQKDDPADGKRAAAAPPGMLMAVMYAPFTRRDDATREVEGVLTSEAIDSYDTMFDYESAKRAVNRWAGNLREMHQLRAVGRKVSVRFDDENKQVILRARISAGAQDTWEKILDGTLTGYSIGCNKWKTTTRSVGGRSVTCYTDYEYGEVSIVDVPSNPDAAKSLTVYRVADLAASGQEEVSDVLDDFVDETPAASAAETPALPAVTPETPAAAQETTATLDRVADAPVTETETETPATETPAAPETPVAPAAPVRQAGSPAAAVADAIKGMPDAAREMITRATALAVEQMAAAEGAAHAGHTHETPAAPAAPVAAVVAATQTPAAEALSSVERASAGDVYYDPSSDQLVKLPADYDDGSDPEKPVGQAMLDESGQAHDEHTHPHASAYSSIHTHTHDHTHQDGTTHSHPHMHAHAHHDHFGDPKHSHPHTHTHDHSHEFRSAAPDMAQTDEPQPGNEAQVPAVTAVETPAAPVAAVAGEQPTQDRAAHGTFTGKHTHPHSAFGSQGGDDDHGHEHSHDGDASHDHHAGETQASDADRAAAEGVEHPVLTEAPAPVERMDGCCHDGADCGPECACEVGCECRVAGAPEGTTPDGDPETITRAGARISQPTRAGIHAGLLAIMRTCGCDVCQECCDLFDPDKDGDDDVDGGAGDDDNDATRAAFAHAGLLLRVQQVKLRRTATETISREVSRRLDPITAQLRAITARLTTVQAPAETAPAVPTEPESLTRMASQLDETRAALATVQGLVERIAQQPMPGGPVLRAADKVLGLAPGAVLDTGAAQQSTTLTAQQLTRAVQLLSQQGVLSSDAQVAAGAAIIAQQMNEGRK